MISEEQDNGKGFNRKKGETAIAMQDLSQIEQVKLLGMLHATQKEMAQWFGLSQSTIEGYMADKEGEFYKVFTKAQSETSISLRRLQLAKAQAGDSTMMIWLGKQILGQKEKSDITSDDKPMQTVFSLKIGDD